MMHQEVCIVLNEQENAKAQAAARLLQLFSERGISATQLPLDLHIEEIIRERGAKVVVLDYLLGDVTTGLDILQGFCDRPAAEKRPFFIFLTDEPSVPVAVQAMRLGAVNYYQLENPRSIPALVDEVVEFMRSSNRVDRRSVRRRRPELSDIICQDQASREVITAMQVMAQKGEPVTVWFGPPGSGRRLHAEVLFQLRGGQGIYQEVDLSLWDRSLERLTGIEHSPALMHQLGENLHLTVVHSEGDGGEFLEFLSSRWSTIWDPVVVREGRSSLNIITYDEEVAESWVRLCAAQLLVLPSLKERSLDIAPMIQKFHAEAKQLLGGKGAEISPSLLQSLSSMEWPGEVAQLRAVIVDALILHELEKGSSELIEYIEAGRQRWDADHDREEYELDPIVAARVFENVEGNLRLAAARLGSSVAEVKNALLRSRVPYGS